MSRAASALVTGGHGFAGRHLVERLVAEWGPPYAPTRDELDLGDREAVRRAVGESAPEFVFHLAAFTSARLSWAQPGEVILTNVRMALNVLEAVRAEAPGAAVVLVGSGQVYGEPTELPVTEDAPLRPDNPYAVSKAACDLLGAQYASVQGMRVARMRPFNHAGPGQSDEFVLASLARQVVEAERAGADEVVLRTGDVSAARDFTDVRDVVRGYVMAACAPPDAYNVCSGVATRVGGLIELLRAEARLAVRHEVDPERLRSGEPSVVWGSHERLTAATGWKPRIPLVETVRHTLGSLRDS